MCHNSGDEGLQQRCMEGRNSQAIKNWAVKNGQEQRGERDGGRAATGRWRDAVASSSPGGPVNHWPRQQQALRTWSRAINCRETSSAEMLNLGNIKRGPATLPSWVFCNKLNRQPINRFIIFIMFNFGENVWVKQRTFEREAALPRYSARPLWLAREMMFQTMLCIGLEWSCIFDMWQIQNGPESSAILLISNGSGEAHGSFMGSKLHPAWNMRRKVSQLEWKSDDPLQSHWICFGFLKKRDRNWAFFSFFDKIRLIIIYIL